MPIFRLTLVAYINALSPAAPLDLINNRTAQPRPGVNPGLPKIAAIFYMLDQAQEFNLAWIAAPALGWLTENEVTLTATHATKSSHHRPCLYCQRRSASVSPS